MKKVFIAFMIMSVFACSKGKDCKYTDGNGDYYDSKEQCEQSCGCACTRSC